MKQGEYSTWHISDIGDLGWRGEPSRHYVAVLVCRWSYRKLKRSVLTFPITEIYKDSLGKTRGVGSQFQLIFSLFNGGKPLTGRLNHLKIINTVHEAVESTDYNICIRWSSRNGRMYVREACMPEEIVVRRDPQFVWPHGFLSKLRTIATPSMKTVDLGLTDAGSKKLTVLKDIEPDDHDEIPDEFLQQLQQYCV